MRIAKSVNRIANSPFGHITHGRVLNCTLVRNQVHKKYYLPRTASILASVDLEPEMIDCRDQGNEGSCTSFGHGANADWRQLQARVAELGSNKGMIFYSGEFESAACNFIYGQERTMDGDFNLDGGSFVHTGAQVATRVGFISERVFPYGDASLYRKPTNLELLWAHEHRLSEAIPLDMSEPQTIMTALSNRDPVVFGWVVYASIQEVGGDGIIPTPGYWFDKPEGGHCSAIFGYKVIDGEVYFKVRNSWGTLWGANGYGWMSEKYMCNPRYVSDGWVVK